MKKFTSWRCGIGLNILLPTAVPVICLSYRRPHGSEYYYDITVSNHTKCVIPHRHTFGLLSHHGRLGAAGLRRKSPLWLYRPPIKNMTAYYNSFVSAFIVVCSMKPKNASGRVLMGPKHNLDHFKSLLGCLPINQTLRIFIQVQFSQLTPELGPLQAEFWT